MPAHFTFRRLLFRGIFLLLMAAGLAACTGTAPKITPGLTETTNPSPSPSSTELPAASATPAPTSTPESTLEMSAEALRGTRLLIWHAGPTREIQALQRVVDEFNNTNEWGIHVESSAHASYDVLSVAVSSTLQTTSRPDILLAYGYQGRGWAAQDGVLVDLAPYLKDPSWGLTVEEQNDFLPGLWQPGQPEDHLLVLPALRSAAVLYYNKTWAGQLGFEQPPVTTGEFQEQACAAAQSYLKDDDRENDHQGGWIISTDPSAMMSWFTAFGAQPAPPGASKYQFDSENVIQAFSFLRGLYDQGCAWLPENEFIETDFAARGGLFASSSSAAISYQADAFSAAGSTDEWIALPYPAAGGSAFLTTYGPSLFVLNSTPERQLAAWLLLRWLTSSEIQARWGQESGYYPVRSSALALLQANSAVPQQWAAVLPQMFSAQAEPEQASWRTVRWAVSDAATQLFRYYFTADQAPALAKFLQETAVDLHRRQQEGP